MYFKCACMQVRGYPGREKFLRDAMNANLQETLWLGDFTPMPLQCSLMGRKVLAPLVPKLTEYAWRCDGLGYAWECVAGKIRGHSQHAEEAAKEVEGEAPEGGEKEEDDDGAGSDEGDAGKQGED